MCGNVDASLISKHQVKKVASANAAFFVPKLLQVREQHQDSLNQAEREHQPFVVIHEVTPSHARGEPTHRLPHKIYHTFIKFSRRFKIFAYELHGF